MIGVTIGDIQGIGPEVVGKALASLEKSKREEIIVIGYLPVMFKYVNEKELEGVNFIDTGEGEESFSGLLAIERAIEIAKAGKIKGICTAPVNKARVSNIVPFVGHTEFLRDRFGVDRVEMIFLSRYFNIILATRHLPVKEVSKEITLSRMREVIDTSWEFTQVIKKELPIGICGLNPHAGETGKIGREEVDVIIPAVQEARDRGVNIIGPLPADTIFRKGEHFSIIITMYHDQGLPVLKRIDPNCVNLTWGLPVMRTSPPHGTAYDIAGKGIADHNPMKEAILSLFRFSVL